ncbi:hypothetical protein LLEC1_05628, partial [Akanthomyces lecanii]
MSTSKRRKLEEGQQAPQYRGSPKSPSTPKSAAARKESASKRGTDKGVSTPESGTSTPRVVQYSSFRLSKQNYRRNKDGYSELRLTDTERFIVLGIFGIRVRSGEVSVLGTTITASETIHWIHASHCHALPVIRASEKTRLELHSDKSDKPLSCLSALSPLYQRIWHETESSSEETCGFSEDTFRILCTSEDAPKRSIVQELFSPPEWNKAISDITSTNRLDQRAPISAFVCGPKGAGKSTFSKLLTNRLLTTSDRASTAQSATGVAVIDLDPGQPEYAPAGTVSLVHITKPNLGTPFSHPGLHQAGHTVLRSHALASVSPSMSPSLYIQCATDLHETYRRTLRNCPLIINTPGWILGTGLDLLVELITIMMPSQVAYMSEDGPLDVVDVLRSATRNQFLTLPSQPSEYTARTGSQLRAMQAMSYFHMADFAATVSPAVLSWNPRPLSTVPPWEVRYASKRSGIKGILSYDFQSPPELFRAAIDGMVLAVVEIEDGKAFQDIIAGYGPAPHQPAIVGAEPASSEVQAEDRDAEMSSTTADELKIITSPEGLPIISNTNDATLDPRHSRALGLVLVRGVDTARRTLQLLSPITEAQLQGA